MSAKEQLKKVKVLLGIEVKLEQMKLEDGAVLEAESFEAGKEVFVIAEEDRVALPVGEYEIEGGKVLVVAEAKEEPKEDEAVEEVEAAEEPKEDEPKEEAKKDEYATKEEVAELKALVEKLMSEKEELSAEVVEEATEEVVEEKVETELSEEKIETELSEETKEEVEEEVKEVELSKEEEVEETKPFKHNPEVNLSSNKNVFSNRGPVV